MAFSLIVHVALLAAMAMAAVPLEIDAPPAEEEPSVYFVPMGLFSPDGSDAHAQPPSMLTLSPSGPFTSGEAHCRCSSLESMGDPDADIQDGRYAVLGPADNPDPHLSYARGDGGWITWPFSPNRAEARGGDPDAPVVAWGRDDALGVDAVSARGSMWGDEMRERRGAEGAGVDGGWTIACAELKKMIGKDAAPLVKKISHERLHACATESAI